MEVLIAEDDSTSRMVLEGLLKKRGFEAVAVTDGREALEILQREQPPGLRCSTG